MCVWGRGLFIICYTFGLLFQSAERGDIVIGLVSAIQDGGMLITLECLDNGKARDIHALKINVGDALLHTTTYTITFNSNS